MADETRVKFKLREDMPAGFKDNIRYPELPAILTYLTPHDGKEYKDAAEFQKKVLDGFVQYLEENEVPKGNDHLLREGLYVNKLKSRFEKRKWDYEVLTLAASRPGECVFGGLEIIVKEK